jgi:hypothetical protein
MLPEHFKSWFEKTAGDAMPKSRVRSAGKRCLGLAGLLLLSLAVSGSWAWAAEPYSIEPAELQTSADLPQSVASNLDARGIRIFTYVNGLKMSVCEIFWAATVSTQDGRPGLGRGSYQNLEPGTLLGVIRFLPEAGDEYREDSHDQKLKPGYYTMRYALLPGGDARDFVLLSPAKAEHDPKAALSVDQLKSQSRLASGTHQPAILRLVPTEEGNKELPSVRMDEVGTCILQAKLPGKSSTGAIHDVTLAVILINPIPEGDGS